MMDTNVLQKLARADELFKSIRARLTENLEDVALTAHRSLMYGMAVKRRQAIGEMLLPCDMEAPISWGGADINSRLKFVVIKRLRHELGEYTRTAIHRSYTSPNQSSFGLSMALAEAVREIAEELRGIRDDSAVAKMLRRYNMYCPAGFEVHMAADCCHYAVTRLMGGTHDGGSVCRGCINDGEYVYVEGVEGYAPREEVVVSSGGGYRLISDCEDEEDEEDEEDYEEDEDDYEGDDDGVKDYDYNVLNACAADDSIKSSAYGDFLMGIELEVASRGYRYDAVRDTSNDFHSYAIIKNDGSLGSENTGADEGFEIVTAPRGLVEHIERFDSWIPHETLIAWDAGCCGMHVHIDSRAFSAITLGKFITLINDAGNTKFINAIAGRHPRLNDQAENYCDIENEVAGTNPAKTLKGKTANRYHMVNTANLRAPEAHRLGLDAENYGGEINTVELRIFRATLSKPRLLAQIEFAHAAVMFCRWTSIRALSGEDFIQWLRKSAAIYPHLAKWYGVRENSHKVNKKPAVRSTVDV